jgi:mRNA-degrading endonuclease toxin of MazEF toxin-antitoxin module
VHRGEIWLPKKPVPPSRIKQKKRHFVLLLSWDAHLTRDRVIIAPLTSTDRGLDTEVHLDHNDGLDECVVSLDLLYNLFKRGEDGLDSFVTRLSDEKMREVDRAMHYALGIDMPCNAVPRIPRPFPC